MGTSVIIVTRLLCEPSRSNSWQGQICIYLL